MFCIIWAKNSGFGSGCTMKTAKGLISRFLTVLANIKISSEAFLIVLGFSLIGTSAILLFLHIGLFVILGGCGAFIGVIGFIELKNKRDSDNGIEVIK